MTTPRQPDQTDPQLIADAVADRIGEKVPDVRGQQPDIPSVSQAIALREQAPEMYDLWLKIAKEKAATANYVDRAPFEVPERLAQSGRPRALGALVIVLAFCGYLAWLGGPGPYIGGLIAILDLGVMFGMFFGLRPDRLPDPQQQERRNQPRRSLLADLSSIRRRPWLTLWTFRKSKSEQVGRRISCNPHNVARSEQVDRCHPALGCVAGCSAAPLADSS